ncbi:MAG: molybdopterin-dependent oxidoreductase [Deltaproteobacteria bacterium]|nr:molybdopterin-dependent oxidoreductase [Deltaproteobacteria bacterium]
MSSRTELTFCRICEATCGLKATIEGNRVVALEPDHDHMVTKGYSCIKGLRYHEIHHSPDRLRVPLKRIGDRFEEISWDQALEEIGAKVRQLVNDHGGDSVSAYLGNPISFSLLPPILTSAFLLWLSVHPAVSRHRPHAVSDHDRLQSGRLPIELHAASGPHSSA